MKLQSVYLTATIHVNVIWHEILIDRMPIRLKAKLTDKPIFGDLSHVGTQCVGHENSVLMKCCKPASRWVFNTPKTLLLQHGTLSAGNLSNVCCLLARHSFDSIDKIPGNSVSFQAFQSQRNYPLFGIVNQNWFGCVIHSQSSFWN